MDGTDATPSPSFTDSGFGFWTMLDTAGRVEIADGDEGNWEVLWGKNIVVEGVELGWDSVLAVGDGAFSIDGVVSSLVGVV